MDYWTQSKKNIWVAGHRGWCERYPENTIPSFKAAIEIGVDQLELDVRVTKDGELLLMHDSTVDRTTNGTGRINDMTLSEIKALDAGSHKGEEFRGVQVPTFREFMELVKDHPTMTLNIELKEKPTPGHEEIAFSVCDRVLAMVDEYGYTDRVVINAFYGKLHEYIQDRYGDKYRQRVSYPITLMKPYTRDPYSYAYACTMFRSFYSDLDMARPEEFAIMKGLGLDTWAGACVKDEASVDEAIRCGVTVITCNNPDVVLQLLRQKGYHK